MLITFKSKAAGDIHMYLENANQVLDVIGKETSPSGPLRGVITAAEIPSALEKLNAAARQSRASEKPDDETAVDGKVVPVGFAQRAFPLIDMLERAQKINADIVWGV